MPKYASEAFICIVTGQSGADLHHLYSQKSHPELKDEKWNLLPLAHRLHVETHNKGLSFMVKKYPQIRAWMIYNNWTFCPVLHKWIHE